MKPHQSRRYRQDRTPPSDDRSWQHANFDDEPAGTQSLRQPLRSRSGGGGGSGRRQDAPRSRSQPPLIAADAPAAITSLRTSPTQRQTSPRSRQRNGGGSRSARRQRAARAAQHETRPHSPSPQPSTPPPKIDAARTVPRVVSPAPSTAVDTVRMPERESSPSSSSERRHRNAKRLVQRAASTTAATVATIKNRTQKIAKAPARAADDEDPTKMLYPRHFTAMPVIQRAFYPQYAADSIEKANLVPNSNYARVQFRVMQTVYLLESNRQRTHKRAQRSRADPWRRYGALKTIHQIGGWVSEPGQRKNRKLRYVKAGTPLRQPPPTGAPITTIQQLFSRPIAVPANIAGSAITPCVNIPAPSIESATENTSVVDEERSSSNDSSSSSGSDGNEEESSLRATRGMRAAPQGSPLPPSPSSSPSSSTHRASRRF